MTIWTAWLHALRSLLEALSTEAGLGLGLAIIAATVLLRVVLLPISWSVAYRKPDLLLALIAGVTTALMITANPDMPEQMRLLMIIVPSVIAIVVALHFCSALSLLGGVELFLGRSNCGGALCRRAQGPRRYAEDLTRAHA